MWFFFFDNNKSYIRFLLHVLFQIREGLNSSVSPCDDLWQAACGGWLKKYPLPKDRGVWNQKQQLIRRGMVSFIYLITDKGRSKNTPKNVRGWKIYCVTEVWHSPIKIHKIFSWFFEEWFISLLAAGAVLRVEFSKMFLIGWHS